MRYFYCKAGLFYRPAPGGLICVGVRTMESAAPTGPEQGYPMTDQPAAIWNGARALGLTGQQRQIIMLAAEGLSNAQIAQALGVSTGTINSHFWKLYDHLAVNGRIPLVLRCFAAASMDGDGSAPADFIVHFRPVPLRAKRFWPDAEPWPPGIRKMAGGHYVLDTPSGPCSLQPGAWVVVDPKGRPFTVPADLLCEWVAADDPLGEPPAGVAVYDPGDE